MPIPEGIDVDDPESLGQFIGRALRQRHIRTRRAIVAIPRDQAVLHPLSLPNVPLDEMPSVVHFQITKELPFALEEAKIDFATFPAEAGAENVDVLVAAVRRDVLEHYQAVCQNAGLVLDRVGLRPFANTVAGTHGRASHELGCMLMVDVGPVLTEIDLIRQGHLAFSRAASVSVPVMPAVRVQPYPGQDSEQEAAPVTIEPTEAEQREAVDNLLVEVNRTIEAYRVNDPGATIDSIIVAGSCGIEEQLRREVAERFGAPARIYNPGETLEKLSERGEEMTAFSAALGLTIGHGAEGALHFDFLHPKEPVDLTKVRARRVPVIAATVIVFLLAAVVFRNQMASAREEKRNAIRNEIRKLKDQIDEVEDFEKEIRAGEAWVKREVVWLDQMATVTELFPKTDEAYVTRMSAKDDGTIRLNVRAKVAKKLEELRKRYEEAGPYEAKLSTIKTVPDKGGFTSETSITLTLKSRVVAEAKGKTKSKGKRSKSKR